MDAVFVTKWQIEKKIVERIDAAFSEEFGALGADAFDHANSVSGESGIDALFYTIGATVA